MAAPSSERVWRVSRAHAASGNRAASTRFVFRSSRHVRSGRGGSTGGGTVPGVPRSTCETKKPLRGRALT